MRPQDRVVLLGGTLIEREQVEGYWESPLTLAVDFPVSFRNLGWSGDTVWCESRGMFDPPAAGYARMLEQIQQINPTLILLGYGNSEAFDGPEKLDAFREQYRKLLADLAGPKRRFVLLSPTYMEASSVPGIDRQSTAAHAQRYNANIDLYAAVIQELARDGAASWIDLRPAFSASAGSTPLTDNGITLNAQGYWVTGRYLSLALAGRQLSIEQLPPPPITTVSGREPGENASVREQLRSVIRDKNELLFHRWRPQNFTYLFGFRKHEQGNNAVEIPQFDPIVTELESKIQSMKPQ
ncbi:MAG: hypothetical protein KDA96_12250 [Planctomycetaceae bacterium]|nr:hypothetical protein [Planctomycetaceae bacterium]